MKKILLSFMLLFAATAMSAQTTIVKGDMTGEGDLTVADVTLLVDAIVTNAPKQTISVGGDPYAVDNTLVLGTWYAPDGTTSFTLNENGTTDYTGASTYKFRPYQGTLTLYDASVVPFKAVTINEVAADYLYIVENGVFTKHTRKQFSEHDYVDLGLPSGTLWATCNVGASTPYDYGNYFAWGETSTKDTYSWSTYTWCEGSVKTLTKYCTDSSFGYNGFKDNKKELDLADDAAYMNWGPGWRMPTKAQMEELYSECTRTWTSLNGVNGYVVKGPNNNTIFLPAAGHRSNNSLNNEGLDGYYWSRTLNDISPNYAWTLHFFSSVIDMRDYGRYFGQSVRPVRVQQQPPTPSN